jgi:hypothetical protein
MRTRNRPSCLHLGHYANASITRLIAGCVRFFTLIQCFDRQPDKAGPAVSTPVPQDLIWQAARNRPIPKKQSTPSCWSSSMRNGLLPIK